MIERSMDAPLSRSVRGAARFQPDASEDPGRLLPLGLLVSFE